MTGRRRPGMMWAIDQPDAVTRPSKLDSPPPGLRCPACWYEGKPGAVGSITVCSRCFVFIVRSITGRYQRVAPSDLTRLQVDIVHQLDAMRMQLVTEAAARWRAGR